MPVGKLVFENDQAEYRLVGTESVIGRPVGESAPDVPVLDRLASRRHAVISNDEKGYFLRNFGQNGTLVNDVRVEVIYLKDGDRIRIGSTTMAFVLESEQAVQDATRPAGAGQSAAPTQPTKLALVVDPDWEDATFVKDKLAEISFRSEVVRDGEEALEKLRAYRFDLVILDVVVPKVDGFELCRRIRRNEQTAEIPVIILTHMASEPEVAHGLQQGADEYLAKPAKPLEFVARVKAIVARTARFKRE